MHQVVVEKYISELLKHNDCVIVPSFGAFIKHYESASIHPITHKFTPPYQVIGFNSRLVLNDSLLLKHLAVGEHCTDEEAMHHILFFIHSLKQHINKFGFFAFENIGRFFLNKEGKLQFDPELTDHFSGDTFGLKEFIVQPIDRTTYTMSTNYSKKAAEAASDAEKKGSALKTVLIMIPIVLLVFIGGLFVFMKQTDTDSIAGIDVMKLLGLKEHVVVAPKDTVTVIEPIAPVVTEDPNAVYSVIVGSFQSDKHAQKFSKKLNKKGLSTVVIEGDGYFRVGLDNVGNKTTALGKREEMLANYGQDIWIMKK
jgi:CCDC81-like prokaryotic HU domain 1/CCDC81-like prokaryotic HU domain 2/SPOR domain